MQPLDLSRRILIAGAGGLIAGSGVAMSTTPAAGQAGGGQSGRPPSSPVGRVMPKAEKEMPDAPARRLGGSASPSWAWGSSR